VLYITIGWWRDDNVYVAVRGFFLQIRMLGIPLSLLLMLGGGLADCCRNLLESRPSPVEAKTAG
jgi:hypothetical protein